MNEQNQLEGATYREIVRIVKNKYVVVTRGWFKGDKIVKWAGGYVTSLKGDR